MLAKMRAAIRSALPADATEVISYQIPAFKLKKVLVWFAAFQEHCSLFSDRGSFGTVQRRAKGIQDVQGNCAVSVGQATAHGTDQQTGKGAASTCARQIKAVALRRRGF
jgi:hypothetical protein